MLGRQKASLTPQEIRKHARLVLRFRERKCANCSFLEYVECCHIQAIADFPSTATLREINDPSNLVFLCPNCHKLLDTGRLYPQQSWTNLFLDDDYFDDVL